MLPKKKVKLNESAEIHLIWTDEAVQLLLEKSLPKIINILITIYYYIFPCYKVRVCSFSCITYEIHLKHTELFR